MTLVHKMKPKRLVKWMAEKFQADVVDSESIQQTAGQAPAEKNFKLTN